MVEVKLKFLQNISHYYNNIFAFHIPIFTIYSLSLNKFNITIHSHFKFMVIVYNQDLHFRIHCKNVHKQYYNSFHHNLTLEKINTKDEHKIHCKSLCFYVLPKHEYKLQCNPMFCWKRIPTQHLNFVLYPNRICGFLPQVPLTLLFFSKNFQIITSYLLLLFPLLFSRTLPPFEASQVTSLWSKTTRIQNSN